MRCGVAKFFRARPTGEMEVCSPTDPDFQERTLSGVPGDDAKHYQERDVKRAIKRGKS